MNFKPENRKAMIQRYLAVANKRLEAIKVLIQIEDYPDAVSRAYYAILDAATAALINKDIVPQSHSGAIRKFSELFIKTGKIDKIYGRIFSRIERDRLQADYWHERTFTKEEAEEAQAAAVKFVDIIQNMLRWGGVTKKGERYTNLFVCN